jgi:DNA-binding LacI/PurR family transcriptional regulator
VNASGPARKEKSVQPHVDDAGSAPRPVIMRDVARRAGVSAMTVSRALNRPDQVRETTLVKIMEAIEYLSYRPNSAARTLATGRSKVIGVITAASTLHGPASTVFSIEQAAQRQGYSVSVASLNALGRRPVGEAVSRLRDQAVDGILLIVPHESAAECVRSLSEDLPLVIVGAAKEVPFPITAIDHDLGARKATRHLLSLGHPTVWHLAGPADWIDADRRAEGWRRELRAAGLPIPPALVGDWSPESGYELGRRLAADPSVTAVFTANDAMALGLLRALREAGRHVPGDVSVTGFDDIPAAARFCPPLTTVRQNFTSLGEHAFHMLINRMNNPESPVVDRTIEPELIVRESSAPHRSSPQN